MIRVSGLRADYGARQVLRSISAALPEAGITGLLGPNGAGKSTLLRCLARVLRPTSGSVRLDGKDLYRDLDERAAARLVALVPQDEPFAYPLTVRELVDLGRTPYLGRWGWDTKADRVAVDRSLREMDLVSLAHRRVETLSGGERKRAVMARALAQEARILLLDEPTAHLDVRHAIDLFGILRRLAASGRTIVVASHELWQLGRFCDRLLLIEQGRVAATGAPARVLGSAAATRAFGVRFALHRSRGRISAVVPR